MLKNKISLSFMALCPVIANFHNLFAMEFNNNEGITIDIEKRKNKVYYKMYQNITAKTKNVVLERKTVSNPSSERLFSDYWHMMR